MARQRITLPAGGNAVPDQSGHGGQFLTTDGSVTSWTAAASPHYSATVGNGSATQFTVTHGLGTTSVVPSCRDTGTNDFVFPTFTVIDANSIRVTFGVPPTAGQFAVTVVA